MSKPSKIDEVLDKRTTPNEQIEYLVKWKNQASPCWETIVNLKKELEMLATFEIEYEKRSKQPQQQQQQQQSQKQPQQQQKRQQQIKQSSSEDEEYEVEEIIEKKLKKNEISYKVKWKGYPLSECTWEPAKNLGNAQKAIQAFEQRQKKTDNQTVDVEDDVKVIEKPQVTQKPIEKQKQQMPEREEKSTDYAKMLAQMNENLGNLKKRPNDEEEKIELNIDEEQSEEGQFGIDEVEKILTAKPTENGELLMTIKWKNRKNGQQLKNTQITNKNLFEKDAKLLIDYYESKLRFVPQKK